MIEILEEARTVKGNNVLNNLAMTLSVGTYMNFKGSLWGKGSAAKDAGEFTPSNVTGQSGSGFGAGFDSTGKVVNAVTSGSVETVLNNTGARIFTSGISWAGLTYSLNIANAVDNRIEIINRPTLMTHLKKESRFFSGTELVNVSGGQFGSNLSRYQIGVSVSVVPQNIVEDLVTLDIGVETSNLQNLNPNLLETVDVGKTRLETTARVHLGETIMLGGLYRREELQGKSGFPFLRDIPLVQYFFSQEVTLSARRSVAILITPRSPDLVKGAVNRAMTQESVKPHYNELIARNPDWFHPHANAVNIFSCLNLDPAIYYEFRTGDILPPSWGFEPALSDKLTELASFLYF